MIILEIDNKLFNVEKIDIENNKVHLNSYDSIGTMLISVSKLWEVIDLEGLMGISYEHLGRGKND